MGIEIAVLDEALQETSQGCASALDAGTEPRSAALTDAKAALTDALPWLERVAALRLPARTSAYLSCSREDLVQLVLVAALTRIERRHAVTGRVPEWCQPEERLHAYLRGILARTLLRLQRDARAQREVSLPVECLAREHGRSRLEQHEERERALACLGGLSRDERQSFLRFGQGRTYAELAAELGLPPGTLAKRRARALDRLRERCRTCAWRIANGCSLLPRGWPK